MTRLVRFAMLVAPVILVLVLSGTAQPIGSTSEYRLSLRLSPEANFISGSVRIANAPGSCFYLSSALTVQHASADHKAIGFHAVNSDSLPGSNEICLESKKFAVAEIEYSGHLTAEAIRKSTTQTNMVEVGRALEFR